MLIDKKIIFRYISIHVIDVHSAMNTNDVVKEALIWIEYDYIFIEAQSIVATLYLATKNDEANIIYDIYVNGDM